jgi:O-antigen ligase
MSVTAIGYLIFFFYGLFKTITDKPIWGIYVYFFTFYLHAPSSWWGRSLPDLRWSFIAAIVTLLALFAKREKHALVFWKYASNKLIFLFTLFVIFQSVLVNNVSVHMEYVFLIIKFTVLIFILQNSIKSLDDLRGVVWINLLGSSYLAYVGITQFSGGRLEGLSTAGMSSANQLAQLFGAVLIFLSYTLLGKFDKRSLVKMPFICAILYALFLTESRGALLGLAVVGALAMFFVPKNTKKMFFTFALLALVAGSILMGPQLIERFRSTQANEFGEIQDKSARSRFTIIESQWKMVKQSPITGHGNRGTLLLSPYYIPKEYLTAEGVRSSHNLVMAMLVDHGFIGASLYFLAVFICMKKIFLVRRKMPEIIDSETQELLNLLAGTCLALTYYICVGMASNNKPLEPDIWFLALIPIISSLVEQRLNSKERQQT